MESVIGKVCKERRDGLIGLKCVECREDVIVDDCESEGRNLRGKM